MSSPIATKVCNLNSVMMTQRDVAGAVQFYRDILGFSVDTCWPDEKQPLYASLNLDAQVVMFGSVMEAETLREHCSDSALLDVYLAMADDWKNHKPGVGMQSYIAVADVDAYYALVVSRGAKPLTKPMSQFYGIRDFMLLDPTGYRLMFFSPIQLSSCQSCGMPLTDAVAGQMYCAYCTDDNGKLKPYAEVLEGTIQGYFMGMQKMARADAEKAADAYLKTMPTWAPLQSK